MLKRIDKRISLKACSRLESARAQRREKQQGHHVNDARIDYKLRLQQHSMLVTCTSALKKTEKRAQKQWTQAGYRFWWGATAQNPLPSPPHKRPTAKEPANVLKRRGVRFSIIGPHLTLTTIGDAHVSSAAVLVTSI